MTLRGNKGDWSELYVLVSLLAEGKLFQSDFDLNKDPENVYQIINALKGDVDYNLKFERSDIVTLYKMIGDEKEFVASYSLDYLKEVSELLYNGILKGKGLAFPILEVGDFIENSEINKIRAGADVKADINLRIYDHRLAKETDLGFSIKSLIGGDSTLFNTGVGNNFIFNFGLKEKIDIENFNRLTYKGPKGMSKITYRLQELERLGAKVEFKDIQSKNLWKNLKMVDGDLPEILAWALYYRYSERERTLKGVSDLLEKNDPLNFYDGEPSVQKLYEYKLKKFLAESAMGMTAENAWLGEYDSFGGVILAKQDGDIVCFHIYDFNLFRNYLIENTVFEQAATSESKEKPGRPQEKPRKRYFYGWLYEEENELRLKLNLQVRFKS